MTRPFTIPRHSLLALFLTAGAAGAAQAQENAAAAEQPLELEALVVTASRSRTPLKDLPANVSVARDLERTNAAGAAEALAKSVPDVDLHGSPSSQSRFQTLTLRGVGDQNKVLILLDGVPINEPRIGNVDWSLINPKTLDRVEVLRGPVSSLYGAGAMGGVMNFVTRTPVGRSESSAELTYGERNTRIADLAQRGRLGKFAYSLAGRALRGDGAVMEKSPSTVASVKRDRDQWNFHSKLSYRPEEGREWTLGFFHGKEAFSRGRPYFSEDKESNTAYLSHSRELDRASWLLRTYYSYNTFGGNIDKSTTFNYTEQVLNNRMWTAGGTLQANYDWRDSARWTAGVDGQSLDMDDRTLYQTSTRVKRAKGKQLYLAPFLQLQLKPLGERLVATMGGRFDWSKSYNGSFEDTTPSKLTLYPSDERYSFSPRAGLLYRLDDWTSLRVAGGRAFQAPRPFTLYAEQAIGNATLIGNPSLAPESLWSYEAGVDRKLSSDSTAKVTFFQSWAKDLAIHRLISAGKRQFGNIGASKVTGVEVQTELGVAEHVRAAAGYSCERTEITENQNNPAAVGNYFTYTPRNKALLSLRYDRPAWFAVDATARYKDIMFADMENTILSGAYWNLDLALSKRFGALQAKVMVENATDNQYDIFDFTQPILVHPGRTVSASLGVSF